MKIRTITTGFYLKSPLEEHQIRRIAEFFKSKEQMKNRRIMAV